MAKEKNRQVRDNRNNKRNNQRDRINNRDLESGKVDYVLVNKLINFLIYKS
jgi:hypothetical protein